MRANFNPQFLKSAVNGLFGGNDFSLPYLFTRYVIMN